MNAWADLSNETAKTEAYVQRMWYDKDPFIKVHLLGPVKGQDFAAFHR